MSELIASKVTIAGIEILHEDTVLFRRIRQWLGDESNFVEPMHAFLSVEEIKISAKEMLAELKSQKLILLFAATTPSERHTHHPNLHINETKGKFLELFVPESIQLASNVRKPKNALRKIGEQSLQALAIDALALYTDTIYCVNHRVPLAAPDVIRKKKVAILALE